MAKAEQWDELTEEQMACLLRSLNPFVSTMRNLGINQHCLSAVVNIYGPIVMRVEVSYQVGIRKKEMRSMIDG